MTLIIILIVFGLQRYLDAMAPAAIPAWFNRYLRGMQKFVSKIGLGSNVVGVIILILPVVIIVGLVDLVFSGFLFGLFKFIWGLFILWYCLDARDLKARLNNYFLALGKNDNLIATAEARQFAVSETLSDNPAPSEVARAVTNEIFWHSALRLFGILFWFIILGPMAAAAYYLVIVVREAAVSPNSEYVEFLTPASQLCDVIGWIPTRFIALGYALVGHFVNGFNYLRKVILAGISKTREIAINSGLAALGIEHIDVIHADAEENQGAINLVNRAIVLWIVIVAVFTLGGWLR